MCTLTWGVNNYVSRQEKVYIGEMKVQKDKICYYFVVLMIISSIVDSLHCINQNC